MYAFTYTAVWLRVELSIRPAEGLSLWWPSDRLLSDDSNLLFLLEYNALRSVHVAVSVKGVSYFFFISVLLAPL